MSRSCIAKLLQSRVDEKLKIDTDRQPKKIKKLKKLVKPRGSCRGCRPSPVKTMKFSPHAPAILTAKVGYNGILFSPFEARDLMYDHFSRSLPQPCTGMDAAAPLPWRAAWRRGGAATRQRPQARRLVRLLMLRWLSGATAAR